MSKELTDKTYAVVTLDGVEIWITKEQKEKVEEALTAQEVPRFLRIDDRLVQVNGIRSIVKGEDLKYKEKIKRGDWKCEYGEWHIRGEECAHGRMR